MGPRSTSPLLRCSAAVAASLCFAPTSPAGPKGAGGTSVWKVGGGKAKSTLYLAGSVHLLSEDDHPLPAAFGEAYAASDALVLEVTSAGGPEAQAKALEQGMYGKGKGIADDLSPEAYKKLRSFLADAGLPPGAMDKFRPWLASMTLSLTEIIKLGNRPDLGVDQYFESRAIEDGMPITGLETVEFQIGLFAKLGKELQEQMLLSTIEDMGEIATEYPKLVKAWREGDDAVLAKVVHESMDDAPAFRREVFDKRNRRWLKKLEKFLAGDREVMVVVGAGHLVGEVGLVRLLRAKGYSVDRMGGDREDGGDEPEDKKNPEKPKLIPVGITPPSAA